jgi:hypothetical protein
MRDGSTCKTPPSATAHQPQLSNRLGQPKLNISFFFKKKSPLGDLGVEAELVRSCKLRSTFLLFLKADS